MCVGSVVRVCSLLKYGACDVNSDVKKGYYQQLLQRQLSTTNGQLWSPAVYDGGRRGGRVVEF